MNKIDNILIEEITYQLLTKHHTREEIIEELLSLNPTEDTINLFDREVELHYGLSARADGLFFPKDDDCLLNGYTLESSVYKLKNIIEILDKQTKAELLDLFNPEHQKGKSLIWNSHNILIYTTEKRLSVHTPNGDMRIDCSNPLYNLKFE